ncbi:MAG: hypothetical protein ACW98D_11540 [Promethearchaeota archaeon]|jgi:predicted nucleic acid-binding protein
MKTNIIADSSFYICFLDDIKDPDILILFFTQPEFIFILGNIISGEVEKSVNFSNIQDKFRSYVKIFSYYEYGEIIKPFFSEDEILKGEHEVIVISYIFYYLEKNFLAILDETWARTYYITNFPEIEDKMIGTIGFIEECVCNHNFFSPKLAIIILEKIIKSKFRIKEDIIRRAINNLQDLKNGK